MRAAACTRVSGSVGVRAAVCGLGMAGADQEPRTSGKPTASRLSARCSHHRPVRDKNLLNTERDGVSRVQRGGQPSASKTVIGSRLAVDRSRRRSPGTGARRPGPGPGRARLSLPASVHDPIHRMVTLLSREMLLAEPGKQTVPDRPCPWRILSMPARCCGKLSPP